MSDLGLSDPVSWFKIDIRFLTCRIICNMEIRMELQAEFALGLASGKTSRRPLFRVTLFRGPVHYLRVFISFGGGGGLLMGPSQPPQTVYSYRDLSNWRPICFISIRCVLNNFQTDYDRSRQSSA